MRAILVRVPNRHQATWHATMLVSSLLVSATIMSASRAPAVSSVRGLAALPCTVRMSMRSCRSRSSASSSVDDRDVVRFFPGEVIRRRPADLAGP